MKGRVIKAFLALHPKSDTAMFDKLRNAMRIGDGDIFLSQAKTASGGYSQLHSFWDRNRTVTDIVIVAERRSTFAQNPNFGILGLMSQKLIVRYWTLDNENPDSVQKVLRKAALVRLSEVELASRASEIAEKHNQEKPLRKGDNCF
jgi:hypothetical protein